MPVIPNDATSNVEYVSDVDHNIGVMGQSVSDNATSFRFSFGSFYNGDFGLDWNEKPNYAAEPTLAYNLEYAGEEWEPVN
ncbi:hypothetical protein N7530_003795 [Penicillium desertorum]|uniref:Uncharacterized protein n=1 Tax=Penicillium desertorum TaxID=1303715 RepID=A0A9W9WX35_9EURO|nr:hypothetical protein N7530_003795 [Penicillium desertorum]